MAEAGRGGDTCIGETPEEQTCVGLTSSITRVRQGHQRRIVRGLLSAAGPDGTGAVGVRRRVGARRGQVVRLGR